MPNQHTSGWNHETVKRMFELEREGLNDEQIAEKLTHEYGYTFSKSGTKSKRLRERDNADVYLNEPQPTYKETTEILEDGTHKSDKLLRMSAEQSKSPEYLLKAHGYDVDEWTLTSAKNNIWNVYSKQDGIQTLYSSKVTIKPKVYELTFDEIKEDIKDLMKDYQTPIYKPIRYADNGKLLEVNISDLHLNKLGHIDGEYDSEEAERAFFFILNDILTRTEDMKFEKIFFIWSHDFFNIDGLTKTTTNGTPQDTDRHFSKMYKQGKRMLIKGIDLLRQFAPVETIQVGANHDRQTSYTLSEVLDAWFKDDDNVIIDTDPISRKYRKFGNCLIGFSHGDKEKKRLGKIMPSDARKEWGETLYSEIHAGHFHSEHAVKEENGVIVRYLSSPSGTDQWHFDSGYVGAIRKVQHFIWDKEDGLLDVKHTIIKKGVVQ